MLIDIQKRMFTQLLGSLNIFCEKKMSRGQKENFI